MNEHREASLKTRVALRSSISIGMRAIAEIADDFTLMSINFSKTNFMIMKSPKKKDDQVTINVESADGTVNVPQRRHTIKYLGVLLDERRCLLITIFHTSICTRIAPNNGVISKLRHHILQSSARETNILQFNLPMYFLLHAILARGSAYKTRVSFCKVSHDWVKISLKMVQFCSLRCTIGIPLTSWALIAEQVMQSPTGHAKAKHDGNRGSPEVLFLLWNNTYPKNTLS